MVVTDGIGLPGNVERNLLTMAPLYLLEYHVHRVLYVLSMENASSDYFRFLSVSLPHVISGSFAVYFNRYSSNKLFWRNIFFQCFLSCLLRAYYHLLWGQFVQLLLAPHIETLHVR